MEGGRFHHTYKKYDKAPNPYGQGTREEFECALSQNIWNIVTKSIWTNIYVMNNKI